MNRTETNWIIDEMHSKGNDSKREAAEVNSTERLWNGNAWHGTDMNRNGIDTRRKDPPRNRIAWKRSGVE